MKTEVSAGGVVVRKNKGTWEILVIKDMNGNWTFPKGIIENGESPQTAAQREIREEVAITGLKLLTKLKPIHYMYTRGQLTSKTVHYFLFRYEGKQAPMPQQEEEISDVRWFTADRALEIIGYAKTNQTVLKEVKTYLWK